MNSRHWIIAALMRLYPASWRDEFGAELQDLLLARPLTFAIACNVLWSGLRQRGRATEPATIIGLAMAGIVTDAYVFGSAPVLRPSGITWPPLDVARLDPSAESYALLLMACGVWTQLRYHDRIGRSAIAAVKVTFIGGVPVLLAGLFMFATVVSAPPREAIGTLVAPIFALPYAAIWGAVGGQLGRAVSYFRHRFAG